MNYKLYKLLALAFAFIINFFPVESTQDLKKMRMIHDLEIIKHHFEVGYAPMQWKQTLGWDLESEFNKAKNQILEIPDISIKKFHQILRRFLGTARDYHVDVLFYSTEEATLPFTIKGAQGRYFIDWIDSVRLPSSHFPIHVGDELLEFDEHPIAQVIDELVDEIGKKSNDRTDQRFAELKLTNRLGMEGDVVPKGPLLIKTKSKTTGGINVSQIHWSYTPEQVQNPLFLESLDVINQLFFQGETEEEVKIEMPRLIMANPLHELYTKLLAGHSGGWGVSKSFLPLLGETVWINEGDESNDIEDINWHAYIYKHPSGKNIGFLRIPHYNSTSQEDHEKKLMEIITKMEEETEALVIDQLHNSGGSVQFTYKVASYLAKEPLKTPHHRIKITQKEVLSAYYRLEKIKSIELDLEVGDGDALKGQQINYQEMMFIKTYCELILNQWNQGKSLTCPTPIIGVDRINPNPKCHYTKPILILIDEMDLSGGDFLPAILQDNQRATLFGCRTAGAGGFLSKFRFTNANGIAYCVYTGSIAERPNSLKIENVGVSPDIDYDLTAEDVQDGYKGYIHAVNQAVFRLLNNE